MNVQRFTRSFIKRIHGYFPVKVSESFDKNSVRGSELLRITPFQFSLVQMDIFEAKLLTIDQIFRQILVLLTNYFVAVRFGNTVPQIITGFLINERTYLVAIFIFKSFSVTAVDRSSLLQGNRRSRMSRFWSLLLLKRCLVL